jgi:PAS domain S-box-containing protein
MTNPCDPPGDPLPQITITAPLLAGNKTTAEPIGAVVVEIEARQFLYPPDPVLAGRQHQCGNVAASPGRRCRAVPHFNSRRRMSGPEQPMDVSANTAILKPKAVRWFYLLFALALCCIAGGYAVQVLAIMPHFFRLERDTAEKDLARCVDAIGREAYHLEQFCAGWAVWDDAYQFAQDKGQPFIDANVNWRTLEANSGLNLLLFYSRDGKLIWGEGFDSSNGGKIELKEFQPGTELQEYLLQASGSLGGKIKGVTLTARGPMLISSQPVLKTTSEGPVKAIIVMGRFLNARVQATLAEQTKVPFQVMALRESPLRRDENHALLLLAKQPFATVGGTEDKLDGYALVADLMGKPALLLKATFPREIVNRGRATARLISWSVMLVVVLIIALVIMWFTVRLRVSARYAAMAEKLIVERTAELRHSNHDLECARAAAETARGVANASALQIAIFSSANFSSIATDATGVIQIFNVGAECMLGYAAADVMNKLTPADFSDPRELVARAKALSAEFGTPIQPGFEALAFKAAHGIEDIYELTKIRKDGSRFPAVVSVTALRDAQDAIIGYLLIGTDNTARKQAEEALRASETQFRELNALGRLLIPPNPIERKFKLITDTVVRVVGADFVRIWGIEPGDRCNTGCVHAQVAEGPHVCRVRDKCLHLLASSGRYTHTDGGNHARVPFGCYKIGKIAAGEEFGFLTNDASTDPRVHNHAWAQELGLVSFAGYRLTGDDGNPVGVLALFSRQAISENQNLLLQGVAHTTAQALLSARVEENLRRSEERCRTVADFTYDMEYWRLPDDSLAYVSPSCERITGYKIQEFLQDPGLLARIVHPEDRPAIEHHFEDSTDTTDNRRHHQMEFRIHTRSGEERWIGHVCRFVADSDGKLMGRRASNRDITDHKKAELAMEQASSLLAATLESTADGIVVADGQGKMTRFNARFLDLWRIPPELAAGKDDQKLLQHVLGQLAEPEAFLGKVKELYETPQAESFDELKFLDGRIFERYSRPHCLGVRIVGRVWSFRDVTERKRTQTEIENIHRQLVEASRRGGMAEIAANVLHNVGNVLNSVNISTGLIVESVKHSRVSNLARVVALLAEHAQDLGAFITTDSRGKHLPAHLARLSEHLLADQAAMGNELESLRRNVEHIKQIVARQQHFATFGGVTEMINVVSLVEDGLRMNEDALGRYRVEVIRDFDKVPPLNAEKHKILQILVNLLRNAKHACQDSGCTDPRLTVRVANGDGRVRISVMDNGIGIPPENLTRIFNHGFTTREDGHGMGLHGSALAAKEMGGSLTVHSDGPGQGAVFTLELPCPSRENSHE